MKLSPSRYSTTLLAAAFVLPAVTLAVPTPPPPPEAAQPAAAPRESRVDAVWFSERPQGFTGGTSPVSVRVFPNTSKYAAVGVVEEFSGGAGEQWRASAWIAAFVASEILDLDLQSNEFLVKVRGHIDGPSAGMLITAAMIAEIQGVKIDPAVTMTGTVNPDGTIGPVGGIPQKLRGAKKAGKRKFGYPIGCQICLNPETKQNEDIAELAVKLGIEPVEIKDIFDAYKLLTGETLPRPVPLPEDELRPSSALIKRLQGAAASLRGESKDTIARTQEAASRMSKDKQAEILESIAAAGKTIKESEAHEKDGSFAISYLRALMADSVARYSEKQVELIEAHRIIHDFLSKAKSGRPLTAEDRALAAAAEQKMTDVLQRQQDVTTAKIDALKQSFKAGLERESIGGKIDSLHSYLQYWQGRAQALAARATYRDLKGHFDYINKNNLSRDETVSILRTCIDLQVEIVQRLSKAEGRVEAAKDWASFAGEGGGKVGNTDGIYETLGSAYSCAAAAESAYFDSLIVATTAQTAETSKAAVQYVLRRKDPEFAAVAEAAKWAEYSQAESDDPTDAVDAVDRIGSGLYAYLGAAELMNKYYNYYGSNTEINGNQLGNRKALSSALDEARRRVLEEASVLKDKVGFIPDSIKINYELAKALRDGSDLDKLAALTAYWKCHFLARLSLTTSKVRQP